MKLRNVKEVKERHGKWRGYLQVKMKVGDPPIATVEGWFTRTHSHSWTKPNGDIVENFREWYADVDGEEYF